LTLARTKCGRTGFRDLELQPAGGDAVVVSDLPLLLEAQNLVEIDAGNGREGRAFACGFDGKARGTKTSRMKALASSIAVIPASLGAIQSGAIMR
jgi:hypothetical protein